MKVERLQDETAENISQIWTAHHVDKECLSAVVPGATYRALLKKLQKCPQVSQPIRSQMLGIKACMLDFGCGFEIAEGKMDM